MIYTTLNRIRRHSPCHDGWRNLLAHLGKTGADDEPLPLLTVLESNGLDDALWCLRAEPQLANIWRMYAVRCTRRVNYRMGGDLSLRVLNVAERHAKGRSSDEELAAAWNASYGVAGAAARNFAWEAARNAVWDAASAAAWDAAWDAALVAARGAHVGASIDAAMVAARRAALGAALDDFLCMLAAHEAQPGESCALNEWW